MAIAGLLGCGGGDDPAAAPPKTAADAPASPTAQERRVRAPAGFAAMDPARAEALRTSALNGTATAVEIDAWAGPDQALLVAMDVQHAVTDPAFGNTLESWTRHRMRIVEAELEALEPGTQPVELRADGASFVSRYAVPLPSGGQLLIRGRHWLAAAGHLVEAFCQCAGAGCTEPPACALPPTPTDALPSGTVLGDGDPSTLTTRAGDATLDVPPHLVPLPGEVVAKLASDGSDSAEHRSGRHIQGLRAEDGSGVFLTEATWCDGTAPCEAETIADNRRKAEVASLRGSGSLRSVKTLANRHAVVPTFGFEIEQRDGLWTRTTFYNRGTTVREVSCTCVGLACAVVKRTCSVKAE